MTRPSTPPDPDEPGTEDPGTAWTPSARGAGSGRTRPPGSRRVERAVQPGRTRPLDMSKDPDRFVADAPLPVRAPRLDPARDPDRYDARQSASDDVGLDDLMAAPSAARPARIDPTADPDRYRTSAGAGQNLEEILGTERTHEGDRSGFEWIAGLVAVLAFILVVAYLFGNVLKP